MRWSHGRRCVNSRPRLERRCQEALLAVAENRWRLGIGTALVRACLYEAKALGVKTVFVLTYQPDFFERLGFRRVSKDKFPHKIWVDCANCPQFPNCTEIALTLDLSDETGKS